MTESSPPALRVLAIDTASYTGSVALVDGGVVLAETVARVRASHSEALLPMIDEVLRRGGAKLADVDLLAVGVGPGSFTGVRIGVATAKGLRIATDKPLVGVTSMATLAAGAVGARGCLATVLDAHRGEVFAAAWRVTPGGDREQLHEPVVGPPEAVAAALGATAQDESWLLVGDLDAALWQRFGGAMGVRERCVLPSVAGSPLARFVAHEALAGRCVRDHDDMLEPLYVRATDAKLPQQPQAV